MLILLIVLDLDIDNSSNTIIAWKYGQFDFLFALRPDLHEFHVGFSIDLDLYVSREYLILEELDNLILKVKIVVPLNMTL